MPYSVATIGMHAFADCDNLTNVYYNGTKQEWEKIKIEEFGNEIILEIDDVIYDRNPTENISSTNWKSQFSDVSSTHWAYYAILSAANTIQCADCPHLD